MLNIDHVYKIFKGQVEVVALNDVSMEINKGEVLAIFGPSGSGKTTLLKCMGNIWRPTTGSIYFGSDNIVKYSDDESSFYRVNKVGFIFQEFNLFPSLNVIENVMLPMNLAKQLKKRERRERAMELMQMLGIQKYAKSFPSELSGGEKQRVAIAIALSNDPDLILCDEPTANLDADNRDIVLNHLRSLATQGGKAIVIVSHDPNVLNYVDRVARIDKGKLLSVEDVDADQISAL